MILQNVCQLRQNFLLTSRYKKVIIGDRELQTVFGVEKKERK